MISLNPINYFVFTKQGYDRMYYGVAGREITLQNAILYLTHKEAQYHADNLNSSNPNQNKTSDQS